MADVLIDGSPVRTQERAAEPTKDLDPPATVVSDYFASASGRNVPQMLLATTVVAVLPLVISLGLRVSGLVSGWVSVGLAVVMSLASSTVGSAYWRKRGRNTEVLFGELLLWGWIRSWRQERELANATRLLALVNTGPADRHPDELTVEQHEHLLQQLAGALEGQDVYLNGHSRRVARHATMIARGMGLPAEEVARIRAAAAVHDVGKLRTPKAVLNKPGRLTDDEFEVIKRHPVDGAEMVAALGDPELTRIVRHHHERLDGAGYPDRLRGEEIPLGARIIAVADTFDAITSARPYRDAAPHQKAIDILRKEAGSQLDPEAVRSFLAYYSGSRPTVLWAIITSSLRRVVSWLSGDPAAAATISASKVAAATAATAAIGAAAGAAPVPVVHHQPARALVSHAHNAPARPGGAATTLGRRGVSVALPTTSANRSTRVAKSPARPHRKTAHAAPARRAHAKPPAPRHPNRRAAHAGTASHAQTGALNAATSGTAPRPSQTSSAGATRQSAATSSSPVRVPSTSQPSQTVNQSQGSNANGNAYGHTKTLGNGHGKGEAKGHGDSTPAPVVSPSSSTPTAPPATVTTPSQNDNGHGNDNGSSNGNGNENAGGNGNSQGNSNGHGNAQASVTVAIAPPAIAPVTQSNQGDQGDQGSNGNGSNGNGNSGDHGNGHGHGG
ncbi:MAG: HD domain-containing phosphohydrolase [Solirubrobacteraceae bacterium]